MTEILCETVLTAGDSVKIDREAGVLYGVKIIGCESRNGRHYPNDTLRSAIPLYENSKVNLDHPDGDPRKSRSYHARFGVIRNVHLREHEGLYADFWFNPKHTIAEQLLWDAEHAPDNVGFSHNVEAVVKRQHSTALVEKIVAVRSVDLVADPASTQGLFESESSPAHASGSVITLEQVERLIEERLQKFHRDVKPQCREQVVTDAAFDSKAFASAITR
jgi:hypothetical protein